MPAASNGLSWRLLASWGLPRAGGVLDLLISCRGAPPVPQPLAGLDDALHQAVTDHLVQAGPEQLAALVGVEVEVAGGVVGGHGVFDGAGQPGQKPSAEALAIVA